MARQARADPSAEIGEMRYIFPTPSSLHSIMMPLPRPISHTTHDVLTIAYENKSQVLRGAGEGFVQ